MTRQEVEGLVEVVDFLMRGDLFGTSDPVDIEAGDVGKFLGKGCEPGGVMADGNVLEAGKAMDREIGGNDDSHGG